MRIIIGILSWLLIPFLKLYEYLSDQVQDKWVLASLCCMAEFAYLWELGAFVALMKEVY
jgi:hypothetical protein